MRNALKNYALTARVDASSNLWRSYDGGVITSDDCGTTLNHSVAIVGYKVQTIGYDYWIVRNSMGKGWGDKGYAQIDLKADFPGICGVMSETYYPETVAFDQSTGKCTE
jgi:C1A family cysteine protease